MRSTVLLVAASLLAGCGGHFDPSAFQPQPPLVFHPMVVQQAPPVAMPATTQVPQASYSGPMGMLVRQRPGQAVTGGFIQVCTYSYLGREYEQGYRGVCPVSSPAQ